jgi:hypothetical protein
MSKSTMSQKVAGKRKEKRGYHINVRQAVGNGSYQQGFFTQLPAGKCFAYTGAYDDMCQ